MKNLHTFEEFLMESKSTWFPQELTMLKDIYIGDKSLWTSIGKNVDDFIIAKGTIATLSDDGTSNKNKEATYKVTMTTTKVEGKRNKISTEEDWMYFGLKDIVNLIKQDAASISPGFFGHDITLNKMLQ
jgi:hypothetical protein